MPDFKQEISNPGASSASLPAGRKAPGEWFFILSVLLAYTAVEFTAMLFHPMWRDEIHPWSMAGASSSLGDLMQRKAVEGHPDLWYFVVYLLRQSGGGLLSLQILHSSMAMLTAFLVLRYAPFTRLQRLLLIFGYFFLFEYAVISRNYAPGVLLLTLYLILARDRVRNFLPMAAVMFLMAQTNAFALILTIALFISLLYEFTTRKEFRKEARKSRISLITGAIVVIAGVAWSIYRMIPPPASCFAGDSHFTLSQLTLRGTIRSLLVVWKAWFPVPHLYTDFWDSNILKGDVLKAILSLFLLFSAGVLFCRKKTTLFLFITGSAGIIGFILLYYYGSIRHHGHMFLLLYACLWLSASPDEDTRPFRNPYLSKYHRWLTGKREKLLNILLIVQAAAGIYAVTVQFFVPFSASREAVSFIRHRGYDRFMLAGDRDVGLESIAGYLDREAFFFSRNGNCRYLFYDRKRTDLNQPDFIRMADSLARAHGDTILLAMNYALPADAGLHLLHVGSFTRAIRCDEKYYLYLLIPPAEPAHIRK